MKRIFLVLAILIVAGSAALFAQSGESSWAKSYDKDGQFNLYGSVGLGGLSLLGTGLGASVAGEYIITNLRIGDVDLPFGVGVRGAINTFSYDNGLGYGSTSWLGWGVGPFASLHLGFRNAPFDVFISAGLAVNGHSFSYPGYSQNTAEVGFLTDDGAIWHFSDAVGLLLEYGYLGVNTSIFDVGLQIKF